MDTDWDESVILDLIHLSEFTGDNIDVRNSALNVFVDNAPGYYDLLLAANSENWKERAHKLKGAARSLGAWRTAKQGERAEYLETPFENDQAREACLIELKARLDELITHIQTILK